MRCSELRIRGTRIVISLEYRKHRLNITEIPRSKGFMKLHRLTLTILASMSMPISFVWLTYVIKPTIVNSMVLDTIVATSVLYLARALGVRGIRIAWVELDLVGFLLPFALSLDLAIRSNEIMQSLALLPLCCAYSAINSTSSHNAIYLNVVRYVLTTSTIVAASVGIDTLTALPLPFVLGIAIYTDLAYFLVRRGRTTILRIGGAGISDAIYLGTTMLNATLALIASILAALDTLSTR